MLKATSRCALTSSLSCSLQSSFSLSLFLCCSASRFDSLPVWSAIRHRGREREREIETCTLQASLESRWKRQPIWSHPKAAREYETKFSCFLALQLTTTPTACVRLPDRQLEWRAQRQRSGLAPVGSSTGLVLFIARSNKLQSKWLASAKNNKFETFCRPSEVFSLHALAD